MSVETPQASPIEELPRRRRRGRRLDLALGIALGVPLGVVVIWAFVFWSSEGAVDAPRLSGAGAGRAAAGAALRPAPQRQPSAP